MLKQVGGVEEACNHRFNALADQRFNHGTNMKTLAEQLAECAVGLRFDELPASVVHEVKRRVIDSLGCALGAAGAEPCVIAQRVAASFCAERGATLLGSRHRAPADWAAFANGCQVR